MIDDFEPIPPPADEDPDTEDRFRAPSPGREPDDDWRSDFRSYLDDPA